MGVSTVAGTLVSVVINNYNYGRYLPDAIASALAQSHVPLEILVVDDGSTDESREVLQGFRGKVRTILKENGGQGSAFNAGFAAALGDAVLFLDADDVLLPDAVQRALALLAPGVAKVHWPLWKVNAELVRRGGRIPEDPLPRGDLRAAVLLEGPDSSVSAPTSGNLWARGFLEQVLPMPEADYRIGADYYLYSVAPAFGLVAALDEPQGLYRMHGANSYLSMTLETRMRYGLSWYDHQRSVLARQAGRLGLTPDFRRWERRSYFHLLRDSITELTGLVDAGETVILNDESRWGAGSLLENRRIVPFPERGGEYGGVPGSDQEAVEELERLRTQHDAGYFAVSSQAFWWLEHFSGFADHLENLYRRVLATDRLIVYTLREGGAEAPAPLDPPPLVTGPA